MNRRLVATAGSHKGGREGVSGSRTMNWFLQKAGITKHILKKDLLLFFLPWLTVFYLELSFSRIYGDGFSGLWAVIWEVIKRPQRVVALPLHRTIGLSLFVIGLTIMIIGQITLWRNYSGFVVIKKGHKLITHGIYRFTRNPMYFGGILVFAGLPVYAASVYGFLIMLPMIPIFLYRIKMEERMLAEHFGTEFEIYRNATKKLIPFIF